MRDYIIQITEEEYNKLQNMTHADREKAVKAQLDPSILYGYGYYGSSLGYKKEYQSYCVICRVGESCD